MKKQTLERRQVKLVKHLINNKGLYPKEISDFLGFIGRSGVSHIKHNRRWYDIETPSKFVGEYLLFLFRTGNL